MCLKGCDDTLLHRPFRPLAVRRPTQGRDHRGLYRAASRRLFPECPRPADGGGAHTGASQVAPPAQAAHAPPNGLRTRAEAAQRLGCSVKTLNGHVASGALALRHHRPRHASARARCSPTPISTHSLPAQTRKDVPACPSTATRARRTGSSTSSREVIAFTARRKRTTRREAEAVEAVEREKAKRQVAQAQAARTSLRLDDVAGRYWQEVGQHHAGADNTERQSRYLIEFFGKDKLLTDITGDDVAKLVAWRRGHQTRATAR